MMKSRDRVSEGDFITREISVKIECQNIEAPELIVGGLDSVKVDSEKGEWSIVEKSVVEAKSVECWALVDFTEGELQLEAFLRNLMRQSLKLGIEMNVPLSKRTGMQNLSCVDMVEEIFTSIASAVHKAGKKLQLILCVVSRTDPEYKYINCVSETRIGVVTQCCSSELANKGEDQYLTEIALNIKAKLGGTNFVVPRMISAFNRDAGVLLVGAAVNHLDITDKSSPSIAAVVGAMNWPFLTRYIARVCPQDRRCEAINNLGDMCLALVSNYIWNNGIFPEKIVIFRDGGSEMELQKEMLDLSTAFLEQGSYRPRITLVVAQKLNEMRLHDVQLGTVVDTGLFHPGRAGFYLCSQPGDGESNPTHYSVFSDENNFTPDRLQLLIFDMCFTFAGWTKPAPLVPPAYYARLAAHRGQLYQEVAAEKGLPPGTMQHLDLMDSMFFL